MTLNELADRHHKVAVDKGWHTEARAFGEVIALIHSELSEALEEHRVGYKVTAVHVGEKLYADPDADDFAEIETLAANGFKPEGIGIELADAIIRILDFAAEAGLDMDRLVEVKGVYNRVRPYRHGGKIL